MVELTIDGIRTQVYEGTTVLEAASQMGIVIPTLCHHDGLTPYGACRVCMVEVVKGGRSSLEASCTLPAADGDLCGHRAHHVAHLFWPLDVDPVIFHLFRGTRLRASRALSLFRLSRPGKSTL